MSLGTNAIAAGSTMVFSRSIDTWPSVSERMSRIVASVTKPSVTSTLPSGLLKRFCSVSAMFSWSWLMMPLESSVCPSGTCDSGAACTVPTLASKFCEPSRDRRGIELRRLAAGGLQRAVVEIRRKARLAEVVEGDGEVVRDVRARGLVAVRLEVFGLRILPARLRGVEVAQREAQRRALRVARDVGAQLRLEALGARVVGERGEPRERGGVARIHVERAPVVAPGRPPGGPARRAGAHGPLRVAGR